MWRAALARLGTFTLCVVGACTFDEHAVAVQSPQVVVHAVLDPGAQEQQVLVERTLSGSVSIVKNQRFDADDPVNSGGGVPVSGALVTITGPDGRFVAFETVPPGRPPSYETGRYVTPSGGMVVRPGASYVLEVSTPGGTIVRGMTTVPAISPTGTSSRVDLLNRDRDSVRLTWRSVAGARSYLLRVESPFGPFLQFLDSTNVALGGDLRNYFASSLERVFIPGFRQRVSVAAVDSNFFDYYRTRNDPFTGSGIINNLEGGIGVFGSAVNIGTRTVDVVQDSREPAFEGIWDVAVSPRPLVDLFRVYVETTGEPSALSGWYARDRANSTLEGMVGTRTNGRVVLEFLANQAAVDTVGVFSGEQRGDSLIGTFNGVTGRVVFLKRPSQSG
jgi:hypothetical protein